VDDEPKEPESIFQSEAWNALLSGIAATFTEDELSAFEKAFQAFDEYMAKRKVAEQETSNDG
jgi:hypothetical protein